MPRLPRLALLAALLGLAAITSPAEAGDFASKQRRYPRVKAAAEARLAAVEASFRDVGAAWPPRGVYIRGFKSEAQVELWAAPPASAGSDARWLLVRSFPVCASSGELGPKRQLGDYQVPEGFYHVSLFNPVVYLISGFRWNVRGAQHYYGVTPDLATFGKAMANGFSLSALVGKRDIMERGGLDHAGVLLEIDANLVPLISPVEHIQDPLGEIEYSERVDESRMLGTVVGQ